MHVYHLCLQGKTNMAGHIHRQQEELTVTVKTSGQKSTLHSSFGEHLPQTILAKAITSTIGVVSMTINHNPNLNQ